MIKSLIHDTTGMHWILRGNISPAFGWHPGNINTKHNIHLFAITVAHTLDDVQSDTPKERSQAFKWSFAYLMFYTCDQAVMSMNHRYESFIVSATPISTICGTIMVNIKFKSFSLNVKHVLIYLDPHMSPSLQLQVSCQCWLCFASTIVYFEVR